MMDLEKYKIDLAKEGFGDAVVGAMVAPFAIATTLCIVVSIGAKIGEYKRIKKLKLSYKEYCKKNKISQEQLSEHILKKYNEAVKDAESLASKMVSDSKVKAEVEANYKKESKKYRLPNFRYNEWVKVGVNNRTDKDKKSSSYYSEITVSKNFEDAIYRLSKLRLERGTDPNTDSSDELAEGIANRVLKPLEKSPEILRDKLAEKYKDEISAGLIKMTPVEDQYEREFGEFSYLTIEASILSK